MEIIYSLMIYPLSYVLKIELESNEVSIELNESNNTSNKNSDINFDNGILSDENFEIIKDNNQLKVLEKENYIFIDF